MVLVDSSIIIDFINLDKYREVISDLLSLKRFATCEIIVMEVLQGIKDDHSFQVIKSFLETLPLISIQYNDYLKAVDIYRSCRKNGTTIRKSIDCIIAAVAINNKLELFSKDRDFDHIRGYFDLLAFNYIAPQGTDATVPPLV